MAKATAKSNVEIVRDAYESFNEGDVESVLATMDEGIEWIEPDGVPYSGTHYGPEAVLQNVFTPSMEDVEGFEVAAEEFVDGGDTVVVLGTFRGTSAETGKHIDAPFAHVCTLEDGRLTRFVNYTNTYLWQQAMGA